MSYNTIMLELYYENIKANTRLHIVFLLIILPLLLRLWFYYDLPLATDEIFYWSMAIFPSIGYYNHAPLVAWLLIPLTWFGDVPDIQIRLMATVFNLATNLVLMMLLLKILSNKTSDNPEGVARLFSYEALGHPTVYIFAWVLLISPISLIAGTIWTTDSPLFLFMSLCLLTVYNAYTAPANGSIAQSIRTWLPCGIWFGLAMLSKYSAIVWGGTAFLYLLYSKQGREHLTRPGPWLAFALSLMFLTPAILWNIDKGWASFLFVFQHGFGSSQPNTLLLLGSLILLLSPVFTLIIVRSHWLELKNSKGIKLCTSLIQKLLVKQTPAKPVSITDEKFAKRAVPDLTFLLFITYIPLSFFVWRSFFSETYLNWVGFSCLTLMLLFSIYFQRLSAFKKLTISLHSISQLLIIGVLVYFIAISHPVIRTRIISYEDLGPKVLELQETYPQAYLYGDSYGMHAILCRVKNEPLPYRYSFGYNNHFDYVDNEIPLGADILLFSFSRSGANRYTDFFDEIQPLEAIEIVNDGVVHKKVYPFLGINNKLGRS